MNTSSKYNKSHIDGKYARIDTASAPGYFTYKAAPAPTADGVYAILYNDGTLVFQNGNIPESGKTVVKTYAVDLNASGDWAPWFDEFESIHVIDFASVIRPYFMDYWFLDCGNLERVDNIKNLDTANVTNMAGMFSGCKNLTALDVSHFDTAKVTNMCEMFAGCSKLTTLDLSHFDTANVTNMYYMFSGCSGLTTLDLSHFNTANVTDMNRMFASCSKLTTLDLSRFNTAKVTDMNRMFSDCSELTALDVSRFNTANVTDMDGMFYNCSKLTELDVSHFDTAKVVHMGKNTPSGKGMFSGCSSLTALDVSHFNTANVTDMFRMFHGCSSLTTLDVSHFDTANVTVMQYMFLNCSGLTTLDVSHFDTANVTNMYGMFSGCTKLKTIHASDKFTTVSEDIEDNDMFSGCTSLIGGNGTKYNDSYTGVTYARIDTASAPGYFTDKNAPAYTVSGTQNGNEYKVTLTNPAPVTVAVMYFDAGGKFLSAAIKDVEANAGSVSFPLTAAHTTRVTLLGADCRPLCVYG